MRAPRASWPNWRWATTTPRIIVRREDEEADARSLMDLMMLGAGIGAEIEVRAEGPQAEAALDADRGAGGGKVSRRRMRRDTDL